MSRCLTCKHTLAKPSMKCRFAFVIYLPSNIYWFLQLLICYLFRCLWTCKSVCFLNTLCYSSYLCNFTSLSYLSLFFFLLSHSLSHILFLLPFPYSKYCFITLHSSLLSSILVKYNRFSECSPPLSSIPWEKNLYFHKRFDLVKFCFFSCTTVVFVIIRITMILVIMIVHQQQHS